MADAFDIPSPPGGVLPEISVVVIGRNEGQRLTRCLNSVRASHYPANKIELIYVDSNSTDDSCDQAEALGARVLRITPEHPCAAAGRNAGWRVASHDYVHFLDGDTLLDPDWLYKAACAMSDVSVACVTGRRAEIKPHATLYNLWMHYDWPSASGRVDSCAGDALFRKSVLEEKHGYDETLIAGEEPDLCFRIREQMGMAILQLDEPMTLHDIDMHRFGAYWKRCFRTGHAYAEVGGRHKGYARWRRNRWRNLFHVCLFVAAIVWSLAIWSLVPLMAYVMLLMVLIARATWRLQERTHNVQDAFLYALHLYLSKLPMTMGQLDYWFRRWVRHTPRALIEYRTNG